MNTPHPFTSATPLPEFCIPKSVFPPSNSPTCGRSETPALKVVAPSSPYRCEVQPSALEKQRRRCRVSHAAIPPVGSVAALTIVVLVPAAVSEAHTVPSPQVHWQPQS
ncbi:hypothetical protein AAHA92_29290 [Salvia divinorum]|uniref:Uncharacterized protein n=1 Tax=Salvia divinorum TaxID=28513 RepID=A0ABD1FXX9_SALDI